jgi:hypothetical protein
MIPCTDRLLKNKKFDVPGLETELLFFFAAVFSGSETSFVKEEGNWRFVVRFAAFNL